MKKMFQTLVILIALICMSLPALALTSCSQQTAPRMSTQIVDLASDDQSEENATDEEDEEDDEEQPAMVGY